MQQELVLTVYIQAVYGSVLLFFWQKSNNKTRVIGKSHEAAVRPAMMSAFKRWKDRRIKNKGGTTNVEQLAEVVWKSAEEG